MNYLFGFQSIFPYILLLFFFYLLGQGIYRFWPFYRASVNAQKAHSGYNLPFEGLRGILALSVFLHHCVVSYYFQKNGVWELPSSPFYALLGSIAVTLFFFLTGYLFWDQAKARKLDPKLFYPKRFWRIFPAYWLAIASVILITIFLQGGIVRAELWHSAYAITRWATMGFPYGNFPDINGILSTQRIMAGVMWSLSYELLFYIAFPALQIFQKKPRFWIFFALVFSLYGLLGWITQDGEKSLFPWHIASSFLLNLHKISRFTALGFCFGMLAVELKTQQKLRALLSGNLGGILSVLSLALLFYYCRKPYQISESLLLFLPFLSISYGQNFLGLLTKPGLLVLGTASYSIYLLHAIILFLVVQALQEHAPVAAMPGMLYWLCMLLTGFLVVVLSCLSYRWVEFPLLYRKR